MGRSREVLGALGVGVVCIGAFVGARYWGQAALTPDEPAKAPAAQREAGPPADALIIEGQQRWWSEQGFIPLTPPVHLPGGTGGRSKTTVWLKLPEGGVIHTEISGGGPSDGGSAGQGAPTLRFPPGTIADRVEYWRPSPEAPFRVADVRGTRIEADGRQVFRVFRPEGEGAEARLFGYEWDRGDAEAKARIHDAIYAAMRSGVGFPWKTTPKRREKAIKVYEVRADCSGCHTPNRPDLTEGPSPINVNRGTDAVGFFTPRTVLVNHAPLEAYRPDDPNAGAACITATCPDGTDATPVTTEKGTRLKCEGRAVPQGRLDLACALESEDEATRAHGRGVCRSRRALYEHLDQMGRAHFAEAFAACGVEMAATPN